MPDLRDVDPRVLRVSPSRPQGADRAKLQRQIARYGKSTSGMPPPWAYEAIDGELVVYNGVIWGHAYRQASSRHVDPSRGDWQIARAGLWFSFDWRCVAMSTNVRQEALAVLTGLVTLAPEVRLGQLMAHLGFLGEDQCDHSPWDIEDEELYFTIVGRPEVTLRITGIDGVGKSEIRERLERALQQNQPVVRPDWATEHWR